MKGFIARIDKSAVDLSVKTVTALALSAAALAMANGCHYRDLVDPCYPQRYEYASRMEVNQALAPQVRNGHILEQTVWNYEFEQGAPKLTPGGMEHLAYLARRRPTPDTCIYLQVAEPPDMDALEDQADAVADFLEELLGRMEIDAVAEPVREVDQGEEVLKRARTMD